MGYFAIDNRSPDLKHYGVLGMKWGVRRYENPDGTLTPAGKKRYNRHLKNKVWRKQYAQDVKQVTINTANPKNHIPHKGITKEYIEGSIRMHPIANYIRYNRNLKLNHQIAYEPEKLLKARYSKRVDKKLFDNFMAYEKQLDDARKAYQERPEYRREQAKINKQKNKNYEKVFKKPYNPNDSDERERFNDLYENAQLERQSQEKWINEHYDGLLKKYDEAGSLMLRYASKRRRSK